MNQRTTEEDRTPPLGTDSPTFGPGKKKKDILSEKNIDIQLTHKKKKKDRTKKKSKTNSTEVVGNEDPKSIKEESCTIQKKSKKKNKHSQNEKDRNATPKFGINQIKLRKESDLHSSITTQISNAHDLTQSELHKLHYSDNDFLITDNASALPLPEEKYTESIMSGLNFVAYFNNKNVPVGNKLFYLFIVAMFVAGYVINFWDFSLYVTSTCSDGYLGISMYFNFIVLVFAKVGVLNYITSEINADLTYDLKFPFLIPILSTGVIANFQLPLIIYNYHSCEFRSPLLQMSFGYFVVNLIALVCILIFVVTILILLFSPKRKIPAKRKKMIKTFLYFIGISAMVLMNTLFLFITFSQIDHFSLSLLMDNLIYWVLGLFGTIIFVLKKKYDIQVFKPLSEFDDLKLDLKYHESRAEDHTPRLLLEVAVDAASVEIPTSKNHRISPELEKIDEREDENDGSKTQIKGINRRTLQEETGAPMSPQSGNITIPNINEILKSEELSQREKNV